MKCDWFGWDQRVALVNLMRLSHCFMVDEPLLHVYFYSELDSQQGGLKVFAEVMTKPQIFYIDQVNGNFAFRPPILDAGKGQYDIRIAEVRRANFGGAMELAVSTMFRGARFERIFRFRNELRVRSICSTIKSKD